MSHVTVTKIMAAGTQPVFIGWLDHWIYEDDTVTITQLPLTAEDLSKIRFSLFLRTKVVTGFHAAEMVHVPVEEYQRVPIGTNCIKTPFRFDNEFFAKMQIAPMTANFIYIPDNVPPLFVEPGNYLCRFDFIDLAGKSYPQAVELTIR